MVRFKLPLPETKMREIGFKTRLDFIGYAYNTATKIINSNLSSSLKSKNAACFQRVILSKIKSMKGYLLERSNYFLGMLNFRKKLLVVVTVLYTL